MINLPSFETLGIVPCWKKVTCIKEEYPARLAKTQRDK